MKLRNKKTGVITDLAKKGLLKSHNNQIYVYQDNGLKLYTYHSLADFNREWEDYNPVEPLINDVKVCKAIKAWADANKIGKCEYRMLEFDSDEHRLKWINTFIEFNDSEWFEDLEDGMSYTIAELCGEEE